MGTKIDEKARNIALNAFRNLLRKFYSIETAVGFMLVIQAIGEYIQLVYATLLSPKASSDNFYVFDLKKAVPDLALRDVFSNIIGLRNGFCALGSAQFRGQLRATGVSCKN